jgi:uncharacterized protein
MRRKDKEIQDNDLIDQIISKAQVCRLGLCKDNRPYIVPVSFGYDGGSIYFHTAGEGMKLEFIASNNQVCFELEHDVKVVPNDSACNWSFSFYSVIGFGTVEEITDSSHKMHALGQIMKHYAANSEWEFNGPLFDKIRVWRISIEAMTGKRSKDKIPV